MNRHTWLVAIISLVAVAVSSCASINVDALPQPGDSYTDGYDIVLEFDNVLNLPQRAKVMMDGTTVGVVTNVAVKSREVDVTARIARGVVVPSNIQAVLQQATVLGDIYVSLDRPHAGQPASSGLAPGATVPLAQTQSPPQLEDTIANLANFVSSGSIQRVQNTIIHINRVTPQGDTARKIAAQVAADLADLGKNIDVVDQWLQGVAGTGQVLNDRIPDFQQWFSQRGLTTFHRSHIVAGYIGRILPSVGSVYSNGYWLVPFLRSLAGAVGAMQRDKQAFEREVPAWRQLFYEDFLAQDKYPAMNITSIIGPDGREMSGNVQDVLRILGASP